MTVRPFANLGYKLLAVALAVFLWVVARGSSSVERGFDIPVVLQGLPSELVVVDQGADMVNLRVSGTRAALRNLEPERLEYAVDLSGAKPGVAKFEVDLSRFDLPRGARIVSRSPAQIELGLESRATRPVKVRADVEGKPADGFRVVGIDADPPRVRITGARAEVLRLSEVATETVDVGGATAPVEREVHVAPGAGHLWVEDPGPVKVRVDIQPVPPPAVVEPKAPPPRRR
ncbi:MAG TPA: CdaR family protein [Myxococcota bacterium]|nr:CdaR family protein [Myxococcota bacterium]